MNRLLTTRNCIIVIALLALAVYAVHLGNAFLDLDDQTFIFKNPLVLQGTFFASFTQFTNLLYVPLTMVSWQLTNVFFGMNAWAFHGTDLLLHIINGALVFLLLEKFTQHRFASLLAALVFVIHPLNSEAVLWASQRKDLLSACFALLSIHTYIKYLEHERTSLLKVGVFPLPILFLVIDWATGRRFTSRVFLEKAPMLAAALIFIYVGTLGAQQFLAPIGLQTMILLAAKGTAYQLFRFLGPWQPNVFLHQQTPVTFADPVFVISMIVSRRCTSS